MAKRKFGVCLRRAAFNNNLKKASALRGSARSIFKNE